MERTSIGHTVLRRLQNNLEKWCQCDVDAVGGEALQVTSGNCMLLPHGHHSRGGSLLYAASS